MSPIGESRGGIACPACGGDTYVPDTRLNTERTFVRRRRACFSCGERFTTYERVKLPKPPKARERRKIAQKLLKRIRVTTRKLVALIEEST
jgi:transcriptional repressor NrdR